MAGERAMMAALWDGSLELVDGCLRVTRAGSTSYLIVWPAEVALQTDGGDVRVVDAEGRVVTRLGERVALEGGAFKTSEQVVRIPDPPMREIPPSRCPGPRWIARALARD